MLSRLGSYGYILATISFVVFGQLLLKWRVTRFGPLPESLKGKSIYLLTLVLDPFVLAAFVSAFIAALAWMAALTRFDLNYAYPFMSLSFVFVLLLSCWLLGEPLNLGRVLGVALIVIGTIVASRS